MKKFAVRRIITLALALALALGISSAHDTFGQADSKIERRLTGYVMSVDRGSRTMIVRDRVTSMNVRVFVPKNRQIKLSSHRPSFTAFPNLIEFERVMVGMIVDLMVSSQPYGESPTGVNQ